MDGAIAETAGDEWPTMGNPAPSPSPVWRRRDRQEERRTPGALVSALFAVLGALVSGKVALGG